MTHRVVITGGDGQLGRSLVTAFDGDEVIALGRTGLDISDRAAVDRVIDAIAPDVVVHAAAATDVDRCETEPAWAWAVNAAGTRWVATATRRAGAHLVYVSTDYVFDGTSPDPYHEWDRPGPLSIYGCSKLAGEREAGSDATIVRTAWLAGNVGRNIVSTVLSLAGEPDRELAFVTDQIGRPTFTDDLAPTIALLARERAAGVWHATGQGPVVSWYEYAREILDAAGHDPDRVHPITTPELDPPRPAPRPANSALENRALSLGGLPALPDHRESLRRLIARLHPGSTRRGG